MIGLNNNNIEVHQKLHHLLIRLLVAVVAAAAAAAVVVVIDRICNRQISTSFFSFSFFLFRPKQKSVK
jgi:uncharacterized membrane protein AbrB (regulator of aidB expression)